MNHRQFLRGIAMIFDNCWHTNFVADSHGQMEFQFDLVWGHRSMTRPLVLLRPRTLWLGELDAGVGSSATHPGFRSR